MQNAAATITVQFTNPGVAAATGAHLSAEVDSRPAGLNGGRSQFVPGTTAYILIYKSANVSLASPVSSAGSAWYDGTSLVQKTETIQFPDTNTAALSVPAQNIVSHQWLGRDMGAPALGADGKTITVPTSGVGVLSIVYNAPATICALVSPTTVGGLNVFSILVVIKGTAT